MINTISNSEYAAEKAKLQVQTKITSLENCEEDVYFYSSLSEAEKEALQALCKKKVKEFLKAQCNFTEAEVSINFLDTFSLNFVVLEEYKHASSLDKVDGYGLYKSTPELIYVGSKNELDEVGKKELNKDLLAKKEKTQLLGDLLQNKSLYLDNDKSYRFYRAKNIGIFERKCYKCEDGHLDCDYCNTKGRVDCYNCSDGKVTCPRCGGSQYITCPQCGGGGNVTCYRCSGRGGHYDHNNRWVYCGSCSNGSTACPTCYRSGTISCNSCYGGRVTCRVCDGDATLQCRECSGQGRVECHICHGTTLLYSTQQVVTDFSPVATPYINDAQKKKYPLSFGSYCKNFTQEAVYSIENDYIAKKFIKTISIVDFTITSHNNKTFRAFIHGNTEHAFTLEKMDEIEKEFATYEFYKTQSSLEKVNFYSKDFLSEIKLNLNEFFKSGWVVKLLESKKAKEAEEIEVKKTWKNTYKKLSWYFFIISLLPFFLSLACLVSGVYLYDFGNEHKAVLIEFLQKLFTSGYRETAEIGIIENPFLAYVYIIVFVSVILFIKIKQSRFKKWLYKNVPTTKTIPIDDSSVVIQFLLYSFFAGTFAYILNALFKVMP